jgi:hypothetical protein
MTYPFDCQEVLHFPFSSSAWNTQSIGLTVTDRAKNNSGLVLRRKMEDRPVWKSS